MKNRDVIINTLKKKFWLLISYYKQNNSAKVEYWIRKVPSN